MQELMDLLEDLDPPRARHTDPGTSHAAARRIKPQSMRHAILQKATNLGMHGVTSYEVADWLGVRRDVVSPNFQPLLKGGFLEIAPMQRVNPSTLNPCLVWVATRKTLVLLGNFPAFGLSTFQKNRKPEGACPTCHRAYE